jgi:hypothetical protein
MRFNTTGHAAWILAAGLCVSALLYPVAKAGAQETAQAEQPAVGTATGVVAAPEQPTRLHPKKTASKSRKSERHAKAKKPAQEEAAKDDTASAEDLKPTQNDNMTPAVANANAQWANDAKPTDTYNMSAQAGNVLNQMDAQPAPGAAASPEDSAHAEQVVSSDQLNELDRAAESQPPLTLAKATLDTPSASSAPSATVENTKPWEQTSMIGKVFIALGGLLTLASAARMFMA